VDSDPNQDLLSQLYADIKSDIDSHVRTVDETLRGTFAGQSAAEIREPAEAAFADIGLHLSDEQLDSYAECVAQGRPFNFVLG
jgi:hypothetical protein